MIGPVETVNPRTNGAAPGAESLIASLRAGQAVDAVVACSRKDRLLTRTGTPYLSLELRDRGGVIAGRVFKEADLYAGRFERGDLVRVVGAVERYRDELQIEVRSIARAEGAQADPSAFLPTSYRDLDELEGFYEHLAREIADPGLAGLMASLLGDRQLRAELRRAPCGRSGHHAFLGGLLEHSVAVATLALELCQLYPRLDRDLLLCAALVHDLGRTREFTYGAEIGVTDEGRLLGHVPLGLQLIARHSRAPLGDARRLALEHCVLTHHGADTGAGRRFASHEALALYRLNSLDASVKGAFEHGL
jgi:3'-5' exoribonuclease